MNIGTQTLNLEEKFGIERTIEMIAQSGFKSINFDMLYPVDSGIFTASDDEIIKYFTKIRKLIDEKGLYVYQTHAPFPSYVSNEEKNPQILDAIIKAIMATNLLGAKYIVVHPPILADNRYGSLSAENKAVSVEFYKKLIPYSEKYNVMIAIENMFNYDPETDKKCPTVCSDPYELADYVDTMNAFCKNGDRFVACLDLGHTSLSSEKPIREYVNILGKRLKTVHIHDNNGISDDHSIPLIGVIDFEGFCLGLKDVGYEGDFVLECCGFDGCFDERTTPYALKLLYEVSRGLCEKYSL